SFRFEVIARVLTYPKQPKLLKVTSLLRYPVPIRGIMKRFLLAALILASLPSSSFGAALGTAARSVIPSDIQQIIAVDYRRMAGSPTAQALHDRVLPDNLKQFEGALKGVGILPDRDIDQLAFASFRVENKVQFVGVAQGQFSVKKIVTR